MYTRNIRKGLAFIGGALCAAVAGFLFLYGALVGFERPLEAWYHRNNH
jgi:hypothetical protein